jgi:hypothetical protein
VFKEISGCQHEAVHEKTNEFLRILQEIDDVVGLLSEHQLAVVVQQAILACEFADEYEGWQASLITLDDEFEARQSSPKPCEPVLIGCFFLFHSEQWWSRSWQGN